MIVRTAAVVGLLIFATPAFADEAMDKCVADTTALGAKDAQTQCECFVSEISEEAAADYSKISDWGTQATDEMKQAGAKCFPELQ